MRDIRTIHLAAALGAAFLFGCSSGSSSSGGGTGTTGGTADTASTGSGDAGGTTTVGDGGPTGGDGTGSTTPGTTGGGKQAVPVTAAAGGSVSAPGAMVNIPAGALAADTTVTMEEVTKDGKPDADKIAAPIYDFGPDGLTFTTPATLSFDYDTAAVPSGATVQIAYLEDGAWKPLADSTVEGGKVTASTTHFTPFTVVWTSGGQTGGACDTTGFTACGGDLLGTWKYTAACMTIKSGGNPFQSCEGASVAATVDVDGSATFQSDGTYSVTQLLNISTTITVPKSCLPPGASCTDVHEGATESGDSCILTDAQPQQDLTGGGTWSVEGSKLTTTNADQSSTALDFCVDGAKLTLVVVGEEQDIMFVATKQ